MKLKTYIRKEDGRLISRVTVDPTSIPDNGQLWKLSFFSETYEIESKVTDISSEPNTIDVIVRDPKHTSGEDISRRELLITRFAIAVALGGLVVAMFSIGGWVASYALFSTLIATIVIAVYFMKRLRLDR